MSNSGDDNFSDLAKEGWNAEFRSYVDDAWYTVRLLLEGESGVKLRVKYENFPDEHDHVFLAESFKAEGELYDFKERFRKLSAQLQDPDCPKVSKGMRVCASDSFGDDIRFYDATVDDVLHKKHSNVNGEDVCECTFLLVWLHGPNVGNLTNKGVADVCLLQDYELQPNLASFIEIALQKIGKAFCKSISGTSNNLVCNFVAQRIENEVSPIVKQKASCAGHLNQAKHACWSLSKVWPSEGGIEVHCENRQDIDIGGDKNLFIVLVQNLDKELSPSLVSEFIRKETSIPAQVDVFPSLPWVPYTNGVIMVDCKKDLQQLFGFLLNPNHFIVSLNGRPWVAAEKISLNDHWTMMLKSRNKSLNRMGSKFSNELKVVCAGTEEYKKAKERRDLFLDFINHQRRLYKKLCIEERRIS